MSADQPQAWQLRPALASDAAAVAATFRASFGLLEFLPTLHTPEEDHAFFAQVVESQHVIVAEGSGRILGFSSETDEWITNLYVHPADLGRGIGSALLRRAQGRARARQDRLQLWCFQQNARARAFYEAHGFTAVEFSDGNRNEEQAPDVRYVWDPPPNPTSVSEKT